MVKIDVRLDEMPKSCRDCWLMEESPYGYYCIFSRFVPEIENEIDYEYTDGEIAIIPDDKRLKSCPLKEVRS